MKLAPLSLVGLTAAIAGLRPASGQELDCDALLMTGDPCSSLAPATTCEGDDKAQLELAVCCAASDVADAETMVGDATAALAVAQGAINDAQDALDRAVEAHAEADGLLDDKGEELTAAEQVLSQKEDELEELCTTPPPPPPPTSGWTPTIGQTWNYHLNAALDLPEAVTPEVDVYMIDMYAEHAGETIAALHTGGKYVVCYISIGTWEEWRADADDFPAGVLGGPVHGWDGELWVDPTFVQDGETEPAVYEIMRRRVADAKDKGCDGIEPDNMSVGYEANTGFDHITWAHTRDYADWFRMLVQGEGMKVAMKNLVWSEDEVALGALAAGFDFGMNEECYGYEECELPKKWFIDLDKPVFHVEYAESLPRGTMRRMCRRKTRASSADKDFSTIVKTYPLWGPYCTCPENDGDEDIWNCAQTLNASWS